MRLPVLDNDIGNELLITDANSTTVQLGSVEVGVDKKTVFYQSASNFVGTDSFWYAFEDNTGRANSVKVTLNVIASSIVVPQDNFSGWPTANVDTVSMLKNTSVTISVLDNDIGQGLALTQVNTNTVALGQAAIQGDTIIYTPASDYVGQDSFWYAFADAQGRENSTQVKLTISDNELQPPAVATNFTHIRMHYDLLQGRSHIFSEARGIVPMKVRRYADKGDTKLRVGGSLVLIKGQLITYRSEKGDYYTAQVADIINPAI